jgi:hypothetical protein
VIQRLRADEGIGVVTALAVAFIVFALGAVWVATTENELGEVTFYRHRVEAINAAEAGARRAMAELQNNNPPDAEWFDDSGNALTTSGVRSLARDLGVIWLGESTSSCVPEVLSADGEDLGEYLVRVERLDAADVGYEYRIEAWGWGPNRSAQQSVLRKVSLDIELTPLDTFAKALFAAKSIVGTNRKEIYGDVYSGESVTVSNYTRIYPNSDPTEAGTGTLEVYGDLFLTSGTNAEFGGPVLVEGGIDDDATGTVYADVEIGGTDFGGVGAESYFRKATVSSLKTGGTIDTSSNVTPNSYTEDAAVDAIPQILLPTFAQADLDTDLTVVDYGTDVAAFESYFSSSKTSLSDVRIVDLDGGSLTVDFKNTRFSDHFVLIVQDGDLTVKGFTKGVVDGTGTPVSVGIVLDDTDVPGVYDSVDDKQVAEGDSSIHTFIMETGFASIPGVVHHLIFAEGKYGAFQQTTIYGTVYGHEDISSNRMEIHFRTPDESISSGFDFVIPDSTRFIAQPLLWRELSVGEGTALPTSCSS